MTAPNGTPCGRTGCAGRISDGYCDTCGMAPAAAPVAPAGTHGPVSGVRRGVVAPAAPRTESAPVSRPAGSGPTRRIGTRRSASSRRNRTTGRLGAGLVDIPPLPHVDPATLVMAVAEVKEAKRYCGSCNEPVGRGRGGRAGRSEGFCQKCGARYSFTPKLVAGDLVGGQYEVAGCLAHGGLGWIYLARDRNVSGRWVVLKGLLDAADADALDAAMAERRFLAEVEHPNIVKIFNFVEHAGAGYIVMEHVGGTSLKDLRKQHVDPSGNKAPLPPAAAIAFLLEILPALGYLHRLGLVYCDFKPDNVIQSGDALKLIDLGGVRRIDDEVSAVYGTVGYQAPEIAEAGPSVSSDLYTVARALAVLVLDFPGYASSQRHQLPPIDHAPVFIRYEALHRFLLKGTATEPDDRFQSADEMADQLLGVLRQVVAIDEGRPHPAVSNLFAPERRRGDDGPSADHLPDLVVDPADAAAAFLATVTVDDPGELANVLAQAPVRSTEIQLRQAAALARSGNQAGATTLLDDVERGDGWDWRVPWYRGIAALEAGDGRQARDLFDAVWSEVPGEIAPQLALAIADEVAGVRPDAVRLYQQVVTVDPSLTSAAFGLARCRAALGDRAGACTALAGIPDTSAAWHDGQLALARMHTVLLPGHSRDLPTAGDLLAASKVIEGLGLDNEARAELERDVLTTALTLFRTGALQPRDDVLLWSRPLREQTVREGLERTYLALARLADSPRRRHELVDTANRVRPRTLW